MKQSITKTLTLISISILGSFLFSLLPSDSVNAVVKYDDLNVVGKATAYEYVRALGRCYDVGLKHDVVKNTHSGKLFSNKRTGTKDTVVIYNSAIRASIDNPDSFWSQAGGAYTSYLKINPITAPIFWGDNLSALRNGKGSVDAYQCDESDNAIWRSMFAYFDLPPIDFLCWSGAPYRPKNTGNCRETADSNYKLPANSGGKDDMSGSEMQVRSREAMKDLVGIDWDNVSGGVRHQVWLNELLTGCDVSSVGKSAYDATSDDKRYSHKSIDETGKEITVYMISERNHNHQYGSSGEKTCGNAQKKMDEFSKEYVAALKIDLSNGNLDTDEEKNSDKEVVTCAIDGIGWILCPVMNFLGNIADGAFNFLSNNFLETNSRVVSAGDNNPVYTAWQAMRNLANALFVVAFIIIIYSQMTGAGISNYGVKRMLPRLVIAAVLVNVSFFICQLAVDLSNVLGYSLRNFFEGLASSATGGVQLDIRGQTVGPDGSGGTFFGGLVTVVLASAAVYVFASALLPVLLGAVVALVMILFILLARQALIILLIVVAPVAFVAYLLPNTQKLFDKWRKMFVALLLVFPIIGLVFGASMFASAVVTAGSNPVDTDTGNLWGQIIGAGIAILPLFIVPGILKKSLDSVGSIGARINSIGGKLTGAANKKGASMYGNSRLAQYKGYRAQNAARRRNLVQTGAYKGGKFNPLNAVSAMNRKANSMSGNFGSRLEARGAKLLQDQDEEAEKEDLARYSMMDDAVRLDSAEADLTEAVKAGDGRKARVAAKALLGSGAIGRDRIKGVLRGKELDAGVSEKLRGAFAGDSDVALATYSYKGEHIDAKGKKAGATFSAVEQDAATYSGKNGEQLATLSPASMKIAMESGGISDRIAQQMLNNPNIKLNDAQADALSSGRSGSSVGSSATAPAGPSSPAGASWSRRASSGHSAGGTSGASASEPPSSPSAGGPATTSPPDDPTPGPIFTPPS